jgi:predicted dehydrogenase
MKKRYALIGAGKMGISHLAILNAHPLADVVAVADPSTLIQQAIKQYTNIKVYADYKDMFAKEKLDAVVIAVPTKYHDQLVKHAVDLNLHVFVEKPFMLDLNLSKQLASIVYQKKLVNQVGYHNKFIGTFQEAKRLLSQAALGELYLFEGNIVGPVILKKKEATWRSKEDEGGGCLMDYAAHMVDLINYQIGNISYINGANLVSIYSQHVDDAVNALLTTENGVHGILNANWSDETHRKMHTSLSVSGTKGKMEVDATELKVYFKQDPNIIGYEKGWNIKALNLLTSQVEFYLRGEEYSSQLDYFVKAVSNNIPNTINTFETALKTDEVLSKIKQFKTTQHG